jgi:hypothetical protein
MRRHVGVYFAVLLSASPAYAQLYSLQQMMQTAIAQCESQRYGQPNAQVFCTCWVNRWVGLWDANDRVVWSQTGSATPHMQQMEGVAAAQCGG